MRSTLSIVAIILFTLSLMLSRRESVTPNVQAIPKAYAEISLQSGNGQDSRYNDEQVAVHLFFSRYSCPLDNLTKVFIDEAQLHNLDYRLMPAISFRESTCDKRATDSNSLGFGSYRYNNQDVIPYVAQAISGEGTQDAKYYKKAMKDSEKILRIYNTRESYTKEVLAIMEEIK